MQTDTTEPLGLANEYATPATFAVTSAAAATELRRDEPATTELTDRTLREGVLLCGMLKGVMDNAVTTARNAARTHLMATLNLACVLRTMHQQAAGKFAVLALYKNYRGAAQAQQYALQLTGGASLPFTYQTARNYIKVLEAVEARMQIEGGLTPAQVMQVLTEHTAAMVAGAYDDPQEATELLWSPWVTEGSLREMYLALAPDAPRVKKGAELDKAEEENAAAAAMDLEALRASFLTKSGGFIDSFSGYVSDMAARVTAQERETVATRLEELAARLRATKTRPVLPAAAPTELWRDKPAAAPTELWRDKPAAAVAALPQS